MKACTGRRPFLGVWVVAAAALAAACDEAPAPTLPDADTVASYYHYEGNLDARMNGNVAEVTVTQPAAQLRRGGSLWARVGPYILLFSDETFHLMDENPGIAGVRIITKVRGGPEIARALLVRGELSGVQWRRSLNIAGKARLEGTQKPGLLEDLVRWGEDHTEYEYNARYTSSR